MEKHDFVMVWESLAKWNANSKALFDAGVDASKHDKVLYDAVLHMLSTSFRSDQMDLILWSIFDASKQLPVGDGFVTVDSAEVCWEYINKLTTTT